MAGVLRCFYGRDRWVELGAYARRLQAEGGSIETVFMLDVVVRVLQVRVLVRGEGPSEFGLVGQSVVVGRFEDQRGSSGKAACGQYPVTAWVRLVRVSVVVNRRVGLHVSKRRLRFGPYFFCERRCNATKWRASNVGRGSNHRSNFLLNRVRPIGVAGGHMVNQR